MQQRLAVCAIGALSAGLALDTSAQNQAAMEAQFTQLLLSSAWCSLKYNSAGSVTTQKRIQFSPDKTWSGGSDTERNTGTQYGDIYRRNEQSSMGRWSVHGGDLHMSQGNGSLTPLGVSVKTNSNGWPIIVSAGEEYHMCR